MAHSLLELAARLAALAEKEAEAIDASKLAAKIAEMLGHENESGASKPRIPPNSPECLRMSTNRKVR
jgi:hypothetical protein